MKEKNKGGRPSDYTDEKAAEILLLLQKPMTLTKICQMPDMPSTSSVFRWFQSHPEFREEYGKARQVQAQLYADEIIDISDDSAGDSIVDEFGNMKQNSEYVNRARLRVDARKWHASKTAPKMFGDKADISVTATMPDPKSVNADSAVEFIKQLTKEE